MENQNIKGKVFSGLIWKFAERIGAQGVSFIVQIVLARILAPEEFGIIALVEVFIAISDVFVTSGFPAALIQKEDADELDFSTAFYFNCVFSILLYGLIFLLSPLISKYYGNFALTAVVRVMAIRIPIAAINSVQQAYVSRKMIFKKFFFATLGGTVGSAAVGILMAVTGFGVWALVVQYLFNVVVDTIILWITVKWRPKLVFSFKRLKWLFSYGWKILANDLITSIFGNLRSLIIGKIYTSSDLAYFNKGKRFPHIIVENINTSITSVMFPAYSKYQNDKLKLKQMMRTSIKVSTYLMCPLMFGMACLAENIVSLILTDKWLPCVIFLQIACFQYMLEPLQSANVQAIKSIGKSDIVLKNGIIKKGVGLAMLLISMKFGVTAIALSGFLTAVIELCINMYPNKKLLDYGYIRQFLDLMPAVLLSSVMSAVVILIDKILDINIIIKMLIQVISGAVIYIALSALFKVDSFKFLLNELKSRLLKKGDHNAGIKY